MDLQAIAKASKLRNWLAEHPNDTAVASKLSALESAAAQYKPSSNYVVFDDSIIDILRKYGLAGAAPASAIASALSQSSEQ